MGNVITKIKRKLKGFDIFELGNSAILYYLLIFYLVPLLVLLGVSDRFVPDGYTVSGRALLYITLGLFALVLGYFNPIARRIAGRVPNIFRGAWNFRRAEIVFWVTFLVGIATKAIRILGGGYSHLSINFSFLSNPFYSTIGFLDWFGSIALVIAFSVYYFLQKKGNVSYTKWKILAWATLVVELVYAIPSCKRYLIIVPILLYLIVRSYHVRLEYWRVILAVAAIAFLVFPFGNACRNPQVLSTYGVVQSETADVGSASNSAPRSAKLDVKSASNFALHSFLYRIDQSHMFSKTLEADEPLLYGKSFLEFFVSLGPPRFIWKDKPVSINASGNEFGHRIGVLGPEDFLTSVGPTHIGDWYMNFGVFGIVIGMFLMGMLWRFIYEYLIKRTNISLSGVLIYGFAWIQVMRGIGNWVAPVYAGFVKLLVVLFIIHYFIRERKDTRHV